MEGARATQVAEAEQEAQPARQVEQAQPPTLALQRQAGNRAVARLASQVLARRVENRAPTHPVLHPFQRTADAAEVSRLQSRLNADGADPALTVTGVMDRDTDAAIRAFQARHGCAVDGIVGLRTWGVIDELERRSI